MKSIQKHLLTARTGCGFSSPSSTMMTESRPRVSRRTLIIGAFAVALVTFVVLIAEGIFTFGAKTSLPQRLIVDAKDDTKALASGEKASRSRSSDDDASASKKSDSSSTSSRGDGVSSDDKKSAAAADSSDSATNSYGASKKTYGGADDVETSASGVESCRSQGDGAVVSTSTCHLCGEHDKLHVSECAETGRVEQIVTCEAGKPMKRRHRACRRLATPAEEEAERKFYVFEAINFGLGIAAYVVVLLRRKRLDSALAKKIEQQLASGV